MLGSEPRFNSCEEEANNEADMFMSTLSLSTNLAGAIESNFIMTSEFTVASKWKKEHIGCTIDGGSGKDGNSKEMDTNDKGQVGELVSTNQVNEKREIGG